MDAAAQLEELMIEVEHLKDENEILFDTVVQMKSSLDRLITVYIGSGKQKMRQAGCSRKQNKKEQIRHQRQENRRRWNPAAACRFFFTHIGEPLAAPLHRLRPFTVRGTIFRRL